MFTTSYCTLQQAHRASNRIIRKEYTICRCWPIASYYTSFYTNTGYQSQKYSHVTQYPNCLQEISTIRSCNMFANSPRFTKYSLYTSQNPVSHISTGKTKSEKEVRSQSDFLPTVI